MKGILLKLLAVSIAVSLVVILSPGLTGAEKGPIRIGLLTSKTGVLAMHGKDQMNAMAVFVDKYGKEIAGRPVEFFIEDNQSNVALGVTKVRKLITRDKVHIVMGGLFASTGYAIAPLGDQYKVPILVWSCPDDLSQRMRKEYVVKYFACSQAMHALGHWVRTSMPEVKKVITFAPDYAFGHETVGGFQKVFEDMGGEVVQKLYMPINTVDYGPYIGQLRKDADGLFAVMAGAMALRFPKQLMEAGLLNKYVLLGYGSTTDEFTLHAMGDEAIGWITGLIYSADIETKDNQEFVEAFNKKAEKDPGYYAEGYYGALLYIYEAIKAINGDVENKEKFLNTLKTIKVTEGMPGGPKQSDGYGNLNSNVYIRQTTKDETGKKINKVLKVYENVNQFWTYKPEEFLKQPVYSRDFPPCKYCEK